MYLSLLFSLPLLSPSLTLLYPYRSLRELKRRRRGVSKELPRLEITQEPPNSLQVQIGSSATITCLAESESTKNIGYSWTFTNSSKMIEV